MPYTFNTLLTEVYERGFQYLNDGGTGAARVSRYINDAAAWIDAQADWPYLQSVATGTTPLSISDLRTIASVTDTSGRRTLQPADQRDLRSSFGDLTTSGTASFYYVENGAIKLYPTQSGLSVTVDYWRTSPDMSPGSEPLMPDRYRYAIVEHVAGRLFRQRNDLAAAQAAEQARDAIVAQMIAELLLPQHQGAASYVPAVGEDT